MSAEGGPTALIVIDMQEIFRSADSEWCVPRYEAASERIAGLAEQFAGRVVFTKFVRDPDEHGSWSAYYDRWAGCRQEPDSAAWELTLAAGPDDAVLTLPTFSKWGVDLAGLVADDEHVAVCGVATDCCVLSTVLGAVDAGKRVTVVTDACAGVTDEAHDQAVALMGLLDPMVRLATAAHVAST